MLPAPFFMRAQDKVLADAAREIQVDVRHVGHGIGGEEALQRKVVFQRVDVREADEVADEQSHGGAAAPARRVFLQRQGRVAQALIYHHLPPSLMTSWYISRKPARLYFLIRANSSSSRFCTCGVTAP